MPFSSPEGSVWQHIANPTPDSENSDFSTIMMWRWFFNFWPKSKKKIFAGKNCRFSLFVGICHLACLFYRLKLHYLHQTSGIRCEDLISGGVYHLDWTRSKKPGKIRKQCYQTLFVGLTAFTTQNKAKLHSDQVSRHSVSKKSDFKPFFDFSWSHPEMGIFFWKNQKVAFFSQKTGSDGFPVANKP